MIWENRANFLRAGFDHKAYLKKPEMNKVYLPYETQNIHMALKAEKKRGKSWAEKMRELTYGIMVWILG